MDYKEIEKFTGNMDLQTFCGWIEYFSGREYGINETIDIPRHIYNDIQIKKRHDGVFTMKNRHPWHSHHYCEFTILYFMTNGNAFQSKVFVNDDDIKVDKWKKIKNFINIINTFIINTQEEIDEILKSTNPYAYHFAKNRDYPNEAFIISPELELLLKAGYTFADDVEKSLETI